MSPRYLAIGLYDSKPASRHCVTMTHTAGCSSQARPLICSFESYANIQSYHLSAHEWCRRRSHRHRSCKPSGLPSQGRCGASDPLAFESVHLPIALGVYFYSYLLLSLLISAWHTELLQLPSCFILAARFELFNCFNFSLETDTMTTATSRKYYIQTRGRLTALKHKLMYNILQYKCVGP